MRITLDSTGQYLIDEKFKYTYGKNQMEIKKELDKVADKKKRNIDFDSEKRTLYDWTNGLKFMMTIVLNYLHMFHIKE